jgi:hypothetical protein
VVPRKQHRESGSGDRKSIPWMIKSAAKQLLLCLLKDESSWIHAGGMDVDAIYRSEKLFQEYKIENVRTNYRNLSAKILLEKDAINFDQEAFNKEKEKIQRRPLTERGYKFWDGDNAQRLMIEDAKVGRLEGMKPKEVWASRDEYKEFPLAVVQEHMKREVRSRREKVYWQKKRNDKARKKYNEFLKDQEL